LRAAGADAKMRPRNEVRIMRALLLALAAPLLLAACGGDYVAENAAPAGGYTLEVRADQGQHVYIVTAPDGRQTASRVADGASTLLDASALQALGAPVESSAQPEVFGLRLPGVDISVAADASDPNAESATVRINAAGRSVHVDAEEGGPGEGDDRANVRITGASEADVRDFINEAHDVTPEVRTQMLAAIGLQ
jgi:hypothetical protein